MGGLYPPIVAHFPSERPIWGLRVERDVERIPQRIEDMARRFAPIIRRVQPNGPIHIVGFCFGGFLAYELALQLREQGAPLGLVTLVDANSYELRRAAQDNLDLVNLLAFHAARATHWARRRGIVQTLRHVAFGPKREEVMRLSTDVNVRASAGEVLMRNIQARNLYRPKPSSLRLFLVRKAENGVLLDEGTLGWQKLARGGVDVRVLPVEAHGEIMYEPAVGFVAREIRDELARSESRPHE
jgi:thioesterase domain-containing protein